MKAREARRALAAAMLEEGKASLEKVKCAERVARLRAELACDPEVQSAMVPWVVEFSGAANPVNPAGGFSLVPHDQLPSYVEKFGSARGLRLARAGRAAGRWFVGYECSDREAKELLEAVCGDELGNYRDAGVLSVALHFAGWIFPGLYSPGDAETVLREVEGN